MNDFKGKSVYSHLISKGVPEVAAKAIVANVAVESGYTFDHTVKQKGERTDPAYGLFQFDPRGKGLDKPYQKYLEDTEKSDSMEAQLDFFVDSVYGDYKAGRVHMGAGNVKKFKEAAESGDVTEATKAFSQKLLRPGKPHLDRRVNAAKNIKQYIGEADITPPEGVERPSEQMPPTLPTTPPPTPTGPVDPLQAMLMGGGMLGG
jgi:hypothetical protein